MTPMQQTPSAIAFTLRAEGLAIASAAVAIFALTQGSWLLFAGLILAPDLVMLGYLAGNRIGAVCYNSAHSYLAPLLLIAVAAMSQHNLLHHIALIWIAHIGLDRAIGYGLKYASGFKQTHLSRV